MRKPSTASAESLWHILRAYGILLGIVQIIKSFYHNFICSMGSSSLNFQVKTSVRQGCVMSAVLFNLVIGWVMQCTTEDQPRGIRWTLFDTLEDLDFADDVALLSRAHQHMQEKTCHLNKFGQQVGLQISKRIMEVMTLNVNAPAAVLLDDRAPPSTETFTYLGSIVRQDGGTSEDIQSRLSKSRNAFRSLTAVWRSSPYSIKTKLKLYHSCVLLTLLYGSECWLMTEHDLAKLSFHTTSVGKIQCIFWPRTISNHDLLARCQQEDMETIITRKLYEAMATPSPKLQSTGPQRKRGSVVDR